ncbi:MAG TPA: hypothetical protein VGR73_21950 [Bryobacteraceae bacterium]|nr:hypothetical protein [Bryobacteraceae bacterium]
MFNETSPESGRELRDEDERWESTRRRHGFFAVAMVLLAAGIAGLAWYAYPILQRHDSSLARLPGIEKVVGSVQQNLQNTDARIAGWSTEQQDLRQKVDKLVRETRARIESTGKQASEAAAAAVRRIEAEVDTKLAGIRTDVASLKAAQERDQTRIASLQQELNQVRAEVGSQSQELAATRGQLNHDVAAANQQFGSLREDQQRNRRDVDSMAANLAVERIDFEASKGHSRQLTPSVSLGLTGTDVRYRRVNGWMWVMPDRRTIWLRNQSALEPVVFYGLADGKKRELVITQVTKNSIAGYLILPANADATAGASKVSSRSADELDISAGLR